MITTPSFVKNVLPGGKIPAHINYSNLSDLFVTIPFAVMSWDDGLDYDGDGNSYPDSPPSEFVEAAFETREEAEAHITRSKEQHPKGKYWLEEGYSEPLWGFSSLYWDGMGNIDREGYLALCLTPEEVQQLEGRLVTETNKTEYGEFITVRLV